MIDYPEPTWFNGADNRNELTERDPEDCPECGAAHDQPCSGECGCLHCRRREALRAEHEGPDAA